MDKEEKLRWAIDNGLIDEDELSKTSDYRQDFLIAEVDSRLRGLEALEKLLEGYDYTIKNERYNSHFDFTLTYKERVIHIELKVRNIESTKYGEGDYKKGWQLSLNKANWDCMNKDDTYYMNVYSDNVARIWDIKDHSTKTFTSKNKRYSCKDSDIIIEEKLSYLNKDAKVKWTF